MEKQQTKRALFELHTSVFLFGFTGILGRLIEVGETQLVFNRMWMTAIMMGILVSIKGKIPRYSLKDLLIIAGISSAIGIHWILFYGSIKYGSVSVAMVCLSAITIFTVVLEPLFFKQKFSFLRLSFALVAMLGMAIMADELRDQLKGIIIGLAAAFFSALFTILNKRIIHRFDSRALSFYEMLLGFVVLSALIPVIDVFLPVKWIVPSVSDWVYLLILSFFCTTLAFNLSLSSLRFLSPFTVNLAINLEPIYGILLAFAIFKEYTLLGPGFYLGAGIVMLAVFGESLWKNAKIMKHKLKKVR